MPDTCFMVKQPSGGGGNMVSASRIIVRRTASLGDVTASLCVADKLIERNYQVEFQSHPSTHCILRRHGRLAAIKEPNGYCTVNLDNAYENHAERKTRHFSDIFLSSANSQLARFGIHLGEPLNCTPRLYVSEQSKAASTSLFGKYPRPWVFVCPRSQNYFARTVPDPIWQEAAAKIQGTKFWLGMHPAPANFIDLQARHFDNVINWLSVADILVTVDTGPLHVAAALGIPVVAVGQSSSPELHLSDQRDFICIWPEGLDCLNCQKNDCPINFYTPPCQKINPEKIAEATNRRLRAVYSQDVSAVIAVYKPDPNTLNRCLECIIPQVDEVIVSAQGDSIVPAAAIRHEKVKYVRTPKQKIGYSGNCNFGARNSNGRYMVLINDDVFVHPESIARMRDCLKPGVGIVSGLLYYGDGKTIYHAGKVRAPGQKGWGHLDFRGTVHSFKDVVELENVNGAMVMVDRKAFYDAGCQDEELPIFANDDALCLSMRKCGYKVMFTPHARGIHLEHQSIGKIGRIDDLLNQANKTFNRKWGSYLTANANTIPGNFDYCNAT